MEVPGKIDIYVIWMVGACLRKVIRYYGDTTRGNTEAG